MYKDIHKTLSKDTTKYLTVSHTTKEPATAGREAGECFVAGYSEETKLRYMARLNRENRYDNVHKKRRVLC